MADSRQKEFAVELCTKVAKVLGHHGNGEFNFQEIKDVALLIVEEKRASLFRLQDDLSNSMYKNLQKVKREIEKL